MNRRTFLAAFPACAAAVAFWPAPMHAQDVEFLRAVEGAQREKPARLTSRARIAPVGEPGQPLTIRGRVFRGDGKTPAPGLTVFAYHTDRVGHYDEPSKGPHSWRLRGWAVTDADGRFTFDTIRPAPYPGRRTAAHVHLTIEGPGVPRRSAGVLFADDELVSTAERAASAKDGIFGDVRTVAMRDGVQEIDVNLRITAEGQYDA
jgi:protocatechuate 3,4-dioxygenase beta subunit